MKHLLFSSLFSAAICISPLFAEQETATEPTSVETAAVAHPAPNFTLINSQGDSVELADFSGKIVVLEWINFDCPFVKNHYSSGKIPEMQQRFTSEEHGVIWLTINSSAEGKQGFLQGEDYQQRATAEGWQGSFLLQDPEGTVGQLYQAQTTPHVYVISSSGILAYAGAFDSITTTNPEESLNAENYLEAALQSLLAGEEVTITETAPYGCGVKY